MFPKVPINREKCICGIITYDRWIDFVELVYWTLVKERKRLKMQFLSKKCKTIKRIVLK